MAINIQMFHGEPYNPESGLEVFKVKMDDNPFVLGSDQIYGDQAIISVGGQEFIYDSPSAVMVQNPSRDNPAVELFLNGKESVVFRDLIPGLDMSMRFVNGSEEPTKIGGLVLSKESIGYEILQ